MKKEKGKGTTRMETKRREGTSGTSGGEREVVFDDCHLFYEDEVYRVNAKNGTIQFGMVVENSEFVSSDEEQEDEEEMEEERNIGDRNGSNKKRSRNKRPSNSEDEERDEVRLRPGEVRVAWHPNGKEEVIQERRLKLADRSLMPGDVVRRMVKDTQRGYCRHVDVFASVQIVGTRQVVYGVQSKELRPLEDFVQDVVVCLDSWVGMIRNVRTKVTLKFADGTICVLDEDDADMLEDLRDKRDEARGRFGRS